MRARPVSLASTPGAATTRSLPGAAFRVSSWAAGSAGATVPSATSRRVLGGLGPTVTSLVAGCSGEPFGGRTVTVQVSGTSLFPSGTLPIEYSPDPLVVADP